jgi:RHS repeat-associated protein
MEGSKVTFSYDAIRYSYDVILHKFIGKERDSESGFDNYGARHYSSNMGWFTSSDPVNVELHRLFYPQRLNGNEERYRRDTSSMLMRFDHPVLSFFAAVLLSFLSLSVSSIWISEAVERTFHIPEQRGEITAGEELRAISVQVTFTALTLASFATAGALRSSRPAWVISLFFANPLAIFVATYIYMQVRFDVPRAYYPAWTGDVIELVLILSIVCLAASFMAVIGTRKARTHGGLSAQ